MYVYLYLGQRLGSGTVAPEGVAASGGVARIAAPRRRHLAGVPSQDGVEERCVCIQMLALVLLI